MVAGGAAAVLTGLLFVALTINREATAAEAHLGGLARQAIYGLASVFVLSLLVLIPDQSNSALGAELLAGALLNLGLAIPRQVWRMKATVPSERMGSALRVAIYDGAALLITSAGVILAADGDVDFAFFLLAAAVIAYTLLAIANSWSLTLAGVR